MWASSSRCCARPIGRERGRIRRPLRRITGARIGTDAPRRRLRFLAEERDWRAARLPELLDQLGGSDTKASGAALNELARHRFPRHLIAAAVGQRIEALEGTQFLGLRPAGPAWLARGAGSARPRREFAPLGRRTTGDPGRSAHAPAAGAALAGRFPDLKRTNRTSGAVSRVRRPRPIRGT